MGEFRVPFQAADSEFVEKRSRFISHLLPVESEEDAGRSSPRSRSSTTMQGTTAGAIS